jgi:hypothetical protein
MESAVVVGLLLMTAMLLWTGVRRHGRCLPALPVVAAMLLWTAALAGAVEEPSKAVLFAGGGALAFWGLRWNRGLATSCGCGECERDP